MWERAIEVCAAVESDPKSHPVEGAAVVAAVLALFPEWDPSRFREAVYQRTKRQTEVDEWLKGGDRGT